MSGPDVSLAFTCADCGKVSYWTCGTAAPFCYHCRCSIHTFRMKRDGDHVYCPACMLVPEYENAEDEEGNTTVRPIAKPGAVN